MNETTIIDEILHKMNVRSFSMIASLILIVGGIYMCFHDLVSNGKIDIKAVFVDGQIETGSLGLMAMFLGVIIVLALNYRGQPYKGQEVNINLNGNEISTKGLSYRKLRDIIKAASNEPIDSKSNNEFLE